MFENIDKQIDTRLPKNDMSGLLIRDCNWSVKTAGPSPYDNARTELFLLGCKKAMSGNPCKGCFNSTTWDKSKALWSHDPIKVAQHIANNAPNKYITIGGGEPTDQIDNLIILCKELKEKYNFHIMMYTWRSLSKELELKPITTYSDGYDKTTLSFDRGIGSKLKELIQYIDIIVDGEFKLEERLWDGSKEDGFISSVGSGNQVIWDIHNRCGYAMRDINELTLTDNKLSYSLKEKSEKKEF